jgi:hypothetical protein
VNERELDRNAARRLAIIRHAREVTGNVAMTCRYYGISRQVFYTWLRRYETGGLAGLRDRSKRSRSGGCRPQKCQFGTATTAPSAWNHGRAAGADANEVVVACCGHPYRHGGRDGRVRQVRDRQPGSGSTLQRYAEVVPRHTADA